MKLDDRRRDDEVKDGGDRDPPTELGDVVIDRIGECSCTEEGIGDFGLFEIEDSSKAGSGANKRGDRPPVEFGKVGFYLGKDFEHRVCVSSPHVSKGQIARSECQVTYAT